MTPPDPDAKVPANLLRWDVLAKRSPLVRIRIGALTGLGVAALILVVASLRACSRDTNLTEEFGSRTALWGIPFLAAATITLWATLQSLRHSFLGTVTLVFAIAVTWGGGTVGLVALEAGGGPAIGSVEVVVVGIAAALAGLIGGTLLWLFDRKTLRENGK